MRLLVCGGRKFGLHSDGTENTDQSWLIYDTLQNYLECYPELIIIQGGARGADRFAKRWAEFSNVLCLEFPAEWSKYGRAAGHIRNTKMLDEGQPDLVLAFPGGSGTANMVSQAKKYGIRVDSVCF